MSVDVLRQQRDKLAELKAKLDAGEIGVSDFINQGQKLAVQLDRGIYDLATSGAGGAKQATDFIQRLKDAGDIGFEFGAGKGNNVGERFGLALPKEYEARYREEILPSDLSPEEKAKYLADLPTDIGLDTDRFTAEREGLRQRIQAEKLGSTQKTERASRLEELKGILNTQADQAYDENNPKILEDLNARGLLGSSQVGKSLAAEKTRQKQLVDAMIGQQSLSDRDADLGAMSNALAIQQGYQGAGLSRDFGLADQNRQFIQAMDFARRTAPQGGGKTNTEKWANGANLAINGAKAVAATKTAWS